MQKGAIWKSYLIFSMTILRACVHLCVQEMKLLWYDVCPDGLTMTMTLSITMTTHNTLRSFTVTQPLWWYCQYTKAVEWDNAHLERFIPVNQMFKEISILYFVVSCHRFAIDGHLPIFHSCFLFYKNKKITE